MDKETKSTKKDLITLDAKLLKNSNFFGEIKEYVLKAVEAASKTNSNINKIMRTLKYDVKKSWKAHTKR